MSRMKSNLALRYKHVEAALVDAAGVEPQAIDAFRARLRHLRNIGLPELPASGSGTHITYSRRQALEILIAIQLENIGHKPQSAAILSGSIVRQSPYGQHKGKDCYVIPSAPSENRAQYRIMDGIAEVPKYMKSCPEIFTVVNVSALVRRLDIALDRSLKSV
jgi:hypothetical protein